MAEPYQVSSSARVWAELLELGNRVNDLNVRQQIIEAVKQIYHRLQIYPQFGQPLRDLEVESAQIWISVHAPVVVQYAIYEEKRQVWNPVPLRCLPNIDSSHG